MNVIIRVYIKMYIKVGRTLTQAQKEKLTHAYQNKTGVTGENWTYTAI